MGYFRCFGNEERIPETSIFNFGEDIVNTLLFEKSVVNFYD